MIPKVLMVGCGDLGGRLARRLQAEEFACFGLRRQVAALPAGVQGIVCDLNTETDLASRLPDDFHYVVMTPVPNQRSDAGYQQAYVANVEKVLAALAEQFQLRRFVLVSSTGVYGQQEGEWVDEDSPTQPTRYNGQRLLEGEALVADSGLDATVVRFSGIYGPGRRRLIDQVIEGDRGEGQNSFGNRIHADDCAGVLAHVIQQDWAGQPPASCYLASDSDPAPQGEVKQWLAAAMGLDPAADTDPPVASSSSNNVASKNKRCSNRRLLASGYEFLYPSFREGYEGILREAGLWNPVKSP